MKIIGSRSHMLICYMSKILICSHLLWVHVELLSAHGHLFIPLHAFPNLKTDDTEQKLNVC